MRGDLVWKGEKLFQEKLFYLCEFFWL